MRRQNRRYKGDLVILSETKNLIRPSYRPFTEFILSKRINREEKPRSFVEFILSEANGLRMTKRRIQDDKNECLCDHQDSKIEKAATN